MGVPKFFRYMSERYPCLSELIKEYEVRIINFIPNLTYILDLRGLLLLTTYCLNWN